jgi:hypothetical protein
MKLYICMLGRCGCKNDMEGKVVWHLFIGCDPVPGMFLLTSNINA